MTSLQRILAACAFQRPDRIPRFESFWIYPPEWEAALGPRGAMTDMEVWVPDETPFPSRKRALKEEGGYVYEVDGWGRTIRRREGAYFSEILESPLAGDDPLAVPFEEPGADARFEAPEGREDGPGGPRAALAKTGGPYLRTAFLRGEAQFLMDVAGDPGLARALADKTAEHLTQVGVEALRRWGDRVIGSWISDDMASNNGPMVSPASFEKVFLPAYRRMIAAYKAAGARYVFLHSDGDVRPLLDMLVDAGIEGLHPLERRAGMDPFALRERYPRLILAGGVDNTDALLRGPVEKIRDEARALIDLGRRGGLILGTHSVSPEIPLEHYRAYHEVCEEEGVFG